MAAYTVLSNYADHDALFDAIVAVPAVVAEAAFTISLLACAGRNNLRQGTPVGRTEAATRLAMPR